jgi:hypothetical protein
MTIASRPLAPLAGVRGEAICRRRPIDPPLILTFSPQGGRRDSSARCRRGLIARVCVAPPGPTCGANVLMRLNYYRFSAENCRLSPESPHAGASNGSSPCRTFVPSGSALAGGQLRNNALWPRPPLAVVLCAERRGWPGQARPGRWTVRPTSTAIRAKFAENQALMALAVGQPCPPRRGRAASPETSFETRRLRGPRGRRQGGAAQRRRLN